MRLGYACINESLKPKKFRSLRLKTIQTKGIHVLKEIILDNLEFLLEVLEWNLAHKIYFYRISSDIMPLITHPDVVAYGWLWQEDEEVRNRLERVKALKIKENMRLSMHPDQFTVLNSLRPDVVESSIEYLIYHADFLEAISGDDMILHVGGVYGDKVAAMTRFIHVANSLPDKVKSYLRIENDDKSYNIYEVLSLSEQTGLSVVFDFHHHRCLLDDHVTKNILDKIFSTWTGIPKVHISSGKSNPKDRSHSDYIDAKDLLWVYMLKQYDVDVMIEAKAKEKALLRLREDL
jgi:UV DNA damage endonuclease